MQYVSKALPAKKNIALVAHDNRKDDLLRWLDHNRTRLEPHTLLATGTTGLWIQKKLNLNVERLISGPLGGDQQIGAQISQGLVHLLMFFWDPFEPMPHDPDIKALLRVAAVWNIPVACNSSSADFIVRSSLLSSEFSRNVPDYDAYMQKREETMENIVEDTIL